MNQGQNSFLGGIQQNSSIQNNGVVSSSNNSFISPVATGEGNINNNNLGVSSDMSVLNSVVPNNLVSDSVMNNVNSNPVSPAGIVTNNNVINNNTPVIPVTPIPTVVENQASINTNTLNNSNFNHQISSELKVESSSPFDIGLNNNTSFIQTPVLNSSLSETSNTQQVATLNSDLNSIGTNVNSTENNISLNNGISNTGIVTDNNLGITTNEVPLTNEKNLSGNSSSEQNVVSVGKYFGYMFLFMIPVVGFIIILIKSFSKKENKNFSNYARAQLLFCFVVVMISVALTFLLGPKLREISNNTDSFIGNSINNIYNDDTVLS